MALADAVSHLRTQGKIEGEPLLSPVAAVSVGIVEGEVALDLEYEEDSKADADMNVVMNGRGEFIEVQGTAEGATFAMDELHKMLDYAEKGIRELIQIQHKALAH